MRVGFIIAPVLSSPLISIQFSQQPGDLLKSAVFSHTVCGIAARDIKKSPARRRNPRRTTPGASVCYELARGGRLRATALPGCRYIRTILPLRSRDSGVIGSKRAMMAATDAEMKARNGPADAARAAHSLLFK
jgi:hypothetical protein